VADDTELGREVAVKFVRKDNSSAARWRFRREAEITGRLEHPGIAPVFGLLELRDGGFCYAMRLFRGETLKAAIEQNRDRRRLLGHFIAACNTVAFAHDNGVLHRDLKPANIMLGPYGETWVLDWGLATAGDGDTAQRSPSPDPSETPGITRAGDVIGTPGLMSPEQMNGEKVGPPADIYALGITLGTLLVGKQPAPWGTDTNWLGRTVPPALKAVCLKAMVYDPADRYASARDLAIEIERYLADESLTAYRDPLFERIRRWAKRRRTVVTTTALALIIGLLATGIGLAIVASFNRDLDRAKEDLGSANEQLQQVNGDLMETNRKLDAARIDAERNADTARKSEADAADQRDRSIDTVKGMLAGVQATPGTADGVQDLRVRVLKAAEAGLDRMPPGNVRAADTELLRVEAYLLLAWQYQNLVPPRLDAALEELHKAEVVLEREYQARPKNPRVRGQLAFCLGRLVECRITVRNLKGATLASDRGFLIAEQLLAEQPNDVGTALLVANAYMSRATVNANNGRPVDEIIAPARESVRRTRALVERVPVDLEVRIAWIYGVDTLAMYLGERGDPEGAVALLRDADKRFATLPVATTPMLPEQLMRGRIAHSLGYWEVLRGRILPAVSAFATALPLLLEVEKANPQSVFVRGLVADTYVKLAYAFWQLGWSEAALRSTTEATTRYVWLLNADPRNSLFIGGAVECAMVGVNVALQVGRLPEGEKFAEYSVRQLGDMLKKGSSEKNVLGQMDRVNA